MVIPTKYTQVFVLLNGTSTPVTRQKAGWCKGKPGTCCYAVFQDVYKGGKCSLLTAQCCPIFTPLSSDLMIRVWGRQWLQSVAPSGFPAESADGWERENHLAGVHQSWWERDSQYQHLTRITTIDKLSHCHAQYTIRRSTRRNIFKYILSKIAR